MVAMSRKRQRADWGAVTKVGANKWRLRYWANGADGYKRRSKTVYGTRKDAGDALAALRLEHSHDAPCPTVGECWERWALPTFERRVSDGDMSAHSLRQYRSAWNAHVGERWASVPVDQVRPLAMQQWLSTLGASAARSSVRILRAILDYAVRYEFIPANPMHASYVMPSQSTIVRRDDGVWSFEQLRDVWSAIRGEWYEAAFLLIAFGGCRVGEACAVRSDDVSEMDGCAVVRIERQLTQDNVVTERLKNRWSRRSTVIPGRAGRRLLELAESSAGWLTDDGTGKPAPRKRLVDTWGRLSRVIVPWHPIKNGRSSWQTNMRWVLGLPPWILEPLMGHVGEGVTGRHYDKPSVEHFVTAVSRAYAEHPYDALWDD